MNFAQAEKIAAAVLYEGYILYPYRASSKKNVQRWNFGTLYPQQYAEAQRPVESFRLTTECLLKAEADASLHIRVRFLQLVRQQVSTAQEWDVGVERTVDLSAVSLYSVAGEPLRHYFAMQDTLASGGTASKLAAQPKKLSGCLEVSSEPLCAGSHKLSLQLTNQTSVADVTSCMRADAMLESFVSAHVLIGVTGGEFVSLLDTPEDCREAGAGCRNVGVFPVLVGDVEKRTMMLCSPIILYDYPSIAPESVGDFFDGTEMDEMLALRVLTLTEEEKEEMRCVDDRARRILERTEMLPQDFLMKVHGAVRGMRPVTETLRPHGISSALLEKSE